MDGNQLNVFGSSQANIEGVVNLGISYNSPTFTIHSSNGSDLSTSNPAFVTVQSKSNPGSLVRIPITQNQSFEDASGTSEIVGNLLGTTTGVAWGDDCPFYLYAVSNDDEDAIAFMLSRYPNFKESPIAFFIGAPDDPVADRVDTFWSLENIDEDLYNNNPCVCIGSIRMQKDSSDDWTVQALSISDGIGNFLEDQVFDYPQGQNGAASGTHFIANGGTIPGFNNKTYKYRILKSGELWINILYQTVGVDGVGVAILEFSLPIRTLTINALIDPFSIVIRWTDDSASDAEYIIIPDVTGGEIRMKEDGATALMVNSDFLSGDSIRVQGVISLKK